MGGLEESYVTRKPMQFTLIVLFIIFIILLPVYFYLKYTGKPSNGYHFVAETYTEVDYWFNTESDLAEKDKRLLFKINYEGNTVQWQGTLYECAQLDGQYRVGVAHKSSTFADVLFMTDEDCTGIRIGSTLNYRIRLVEWKVNVFIGEQGEILSFSE